MGGLAYIAIINGGRNQPKLLVQLGNHGRAKQTVGCDRQGNKGHDQPWWGWEKRTTKARTHTHTHTHTYTHTHTQTQRERERERRRTSHRIRNRPSHRGTRANTHTLPQTGPPNWNCSGCHWWHEKTWQIEFEILTFRREKSRRAPDCASNGPRPPQILWFRCSIKGIG